MDTQTQKKLIYAMLEKEFDVVVVGSIIVDLVSYANRIPKLGETIEGSDFKTGFGGKGANQCVAAARLGAKCSFVGKVGDDDNGKRYLANLDSEHVDVGAIEVEKGVPTGVASIMVGENDGQNIIIIVPGANKKVTPEYVRARAEDAIQRAKVVLVQLEIPMESSLTALELAKKHGVLSIFNVAPGLKDIPKQMFGLASILCLNETEAEIVTGIQNINSPLEAEAAIRKLVEDFSCQNVIITLGPQGAVVWDANEQEMLTLPAPTVKAVDSTGAGDCFVGTLAYCLARGDRLKTSISQAITNASESVLGKGTQSSFPRKLM